MQLAAMGALMLALGTNAAGQSGATTPAWMAVTSASLRQELAASLDEESRGRLDRGLRQLTLLWRDEDGDATAFAGFVRQFFARDEATLDADFERYDRLLEDVDGHMTELTRELREQVDLDRGSMLPVDELFAGYDPSAHIADDFFANRLAFVVLLNFPLTTLEERLAQGEGWSSRQWAEARLAQRFGRRVPASVGLEVARVTANAERYISEYNIWAHHLLDGQGRRPFPKGMKLIAHWNLRDQIKAEYADPQAGLARQRLIERVMEDIVRQTIPQAVINNPTVDWDPVADTVREAPADTREQEAPRAQTAPTSQPEPDTRYAILGSVFQAMRLVDPYAPMTPTYIARRFDEDREIPEERARAMFEQVLSSPLLARVARLIGMRLGRPLEPFDIWYDGFRPRGGTSEEELDAIVRERYPNVQAFEADIPRILVRLGFTEERARFIASQIAVDPSRGAGHAMGAAMPSAKSRLRTRVPAAGMDYKGFNIALHELGHNVEQTISLHDVDYALISGVPSAAFTEAFAFVFQGHDLEMLGVAAPDNNVQELQAVNQYWATCEIAAVALVDMGVWHWMYDNPEASPEQIKQATLRIARDVWNRFYAPVMGLRDVDLLAVYSHMIDYPLYLPDYPIGHMIAFQIEEQMRRAGSVGPEFERMARAGRLTPDAWMRRATGSPVGPEALLTATERALTGLER
jgi:hypothetical protein